MKLVICAPSALVVHAELRDLMIPPHPFLRRDVVILTCHRDMERVRGMGSFSWTIVPRHHVPQSVQATLATLSRGENFGQYGWHEAIARLLAWRQYHEC